MGCKFYYIDIYLLFFLPLYKDSQKIIVCIPHMFYKIKNVTRNTYGRVIIVPSS